jgi:deoxyribodipyrimidine photo-lyase
LNLILPKKKWFEKFEKFWTPGEDMAKTLLKSFIKKKIVDYGTNSDNPSI